MATAHLVDVAYSWGCEQFWATHGSSSVRVMTCASNGFTRTVVSLYGVRLTILPGSTHTGPRRPS